ncbi:MAG: DUF1631 domain-containing protein [Thiohalocapsa sp.]|jgi:hypothetical protein|uniref:DUF1631 family protein n=1 Tax=Thiohalocapsa sp. TaxID=2497641 RepID=UPI0025CCF6E4|nr:DUF1631 family protein [Thiohalocapsa sp.]MCG6943020.1 DUF1631 domain-containing protein [Thiohalocapsa sp.]
MASDQPAPPDAQRIAFPPATLQRMLGHCTERLQRELPPLVDSALQRVDDALYEFADKAESDRSYASYFEAQRYLRHRRTNLKRRFLRNLTDTVALFQDAAHNLRLTSERSFDSADLQILAEKDLEESLVLTNMISKAETRYIRPLRDLTRHFGQLIARPELDQRDVPVSPTAIANAFAAALRSIDALDLSTVLVVHKIFDQQVMDRLDAFYAGCVEYALAQGLSPSSRRHEIVKNGDQASPAEAQAAATHNHDAPTEAQGPAASTEHATLGAVPTARRAAASSPTTDTAAGHDSAASMFEALRQMLAGARHIDPNRSPQATLATQDLIALLSGVEPETAQQAADVALAPTALRNAVGDRLRASMDPTQPRRLAPNDEDTMDLVFLLFEQLLAGNDMPDAIKVLVSRLQIPYVKLALIDQNFFDDPEHPARRLLNLIAQASIGWNESDRDQDDGLYARIDHLVQRVVTEMYTDPALFSALEHELAQHVTGAQAQAALAEQRVVRQAAARNARRGARRRALALVEARTSREDLPRIVRTILEEAWLEAMVRADADGGEQDRRWRAGKRVLEDLVWSVAPKRDAAERRELLRRIPELLRDLRACLGTVIVDQQLLARWLKELQTVHIAALRGQSATDLDGELRRETGGDAGAVLHPTRTTPNDADALPVGCWLGVARDDGSIQRFKLAWRGEAGDPLLFVDCLGRKGFELPQPELEALLGQDLATVIGTGEVPLVDRAMEAVRQSLSIR